MARMGHDSMHAALIYQHASRTADRSIADHLDAYFTAATGVAEDAVDAKEDADGHADWRGRS